MIFHFFIKASFIVGTKGWYCATKGYICFSSLLFCFRSAVFLYASVTSGINFSFKIVWLASVYQALFTILPQTLLQRSLFSYDISILTLSGSQEVKLYIMQGPI